MLSAEENQLLVQTGPGTPMGHLMRRYWQPIGAVAEVDDSPFRTKEVTVLGEELVLYRDRSGRLGLIESRCSHRRVNLAYGVVEEDGIRGQYHGWTFNETGACIEQPFEETVRPDGRFNEADGRLKVNILFNQDYMTWITQGDIALRDKEKLGESDRGIILFRRMLHDEMVKVQETGQDPMNTFRDPSRNVCVEPPLEHFKFGNKLPPAVYNPGEEGYSRDAKLIEQTMRTWPDAAGVEDAGDRPVIAPVL